MSTGQGEIFYDGNCGVCSRFMTRITPWLLRHGFSVAKLQDEGVAARLGVSEEEVAADFRMLLANGETRVGADVYRQIMKSIRWMRPIYRLSVVPGFAWVFDETYAWVRDNRHRISSACRIQPVTRVDS